MLDGVTQDLVKKTDNKHCDYLNLQGALLKIVTVCEYVEQMSDHAIKLEKKMELATKILFPKDASVVLALPHRKYLWEDSVTLSADLSLSGTRSIHHQVSLLFFFPSLAPSLSLSLPLSLPFFMILFFFYAIFFIYFFGIFCKKLFIIKIIFLIYVV